MRLGMNLRRDHILPLAVSPLSWSPVLRTAASSSHETVKKVPLPPPISPEISPLAPPSAASSTSLASPAHPLTNSRPGRPADVGLDGSTRTFPPPERGRTENCLCLATVTVGSFENVQIASSLSRMLGFMKSKLDTLTPWVRILRVMAFVPTILGLHVLKKRHRFTPPQSCE